MRLVMKNLRGLKLRQYAARMIDINEYFFMFPGAKVTDKILWDGVKWNFVEQHA